MANSYQMPPLDNLDWLQGSPETLAKNYHLCLLFQVNCPGCHVHAIPAAKQLLQQLLKGDEDEERNTVARHSSPLESSIDLDVYGVSTAFEDFQYNNLENTKLLLDEGRLVGVSKERLGENSSSKMPFPVAFDRVVAKTLADENELSLALEMTKMNAREQLQAMGIPSMQAVAAAEQLASDSLPEYIASVFYAVAAPGTPCWILHDHGGRVLDRVFGEYDATQLASWIRTALDSDNEATRTYSK